MNKFSILSELNNLICKANHCKVMTLVKSNKCRKKEEIIL
jgi:hypothetical protein